MKLNLIDFDDTLCFTNQALFEAYEIAFRNIAKIELPKRLWMKHFGKSHIEIGKALGIKDHTLLKKVHKKKYEIYPFDFIDKIKINKNLCKQFTFDATTEINVIVTNTSYHTVDNILEYLKFPKEYIECVVSASECNKKKPSPQLYLTAYYRMKEDYDCIESVNIYEDSYVGLKSAIKMFNIIKDDHCEKTLFAVDNSIIRPIEWR